MSSSKETLGEMWARQQISDQDVDYDLWTKRREALRQMAKMSHSCLFTVDVYKEQYDFASDSFADIFGYNQSHIRTIERQGDLLEERIHPDDRDRMLELQIRHSRFIYSLPVERRNDFRNAYQFRMLNASGKYINVISRTQVTQQDRNGKAWIIMGIMDISPDQTPLETVKYSVLDLKSGELISIPVTDNDDPVLTKREIEILKLIRQGLLSKEIADRLNISIYTVNNHRKNILTKLKANNILEAINLLHSSVVSR